MKNLELKQIILNSRMKLKTYLNLLKLLLEKIVNNTKIKWKNLNSDITKMEIIKVPNSITKEWSKK